MLDAVYSPPGGQVGYSFPPSSRRAEASAMLQMDPNADLTPWFDNKDYSNMVFIVDTQRFFAHSEVIKARCPYFYGLMDNIIDYDGYYVEVEIRDCTTEVFSIILKFIYTQKGDIHTDNMWLIYDASKHYQLDLLRQQCRDFILSQVHQDNVWDYIDTAAQLDAPEIVEKCRNFAQNIYKEATTTRHLSGGIPKASYRPSLNEFFSQEAVSSPVPSSQVLGYTPTYPEPTQQPPIAYNQYSPSLRNSGSTTGTPPPTGNPPHNVSPHPLPGMSRPSQPPTQPNNNFYPSPSYSTAASAYEAPLPIPSPPAIPAPAPVLDPTKSETSQKTKREWTMEHLNYLAEMVRVLLEADRISLFLYNEESKELCALMNNTCEIRIPFNLGIAGAVFTTGKTVNLKDPYSDSRFLSDVDKQTGYVTTSILCMAISGIRGCIGVIELLNKRSHGPTTVHFNDDDEKTLNTVCHLAGSLLDKLSEVYPPEGVVRPTTTPAPAITNDAHIRSLQRLEIKQEGVAHSSMATPPPSGSFSSSSGSFSSASNITPSILANAPTLHEEAKRSSNKRVKGEINWHRYKRGRKNSIPVFHFRISNAGGGANSASSATPGSGK
jgi:hypothetical protein